ncbi:MAG: glycosyltransferase [Dehalococcoidia bacterium]|nr:MAG: glycosyltransferase [Dehalococcoidia bacterium]
MGLKLKILVLLGLKCRYACKCALYQPDGFTCNHPTAEESYCGKYREFDPLLYLNWVLLASISTLAHLQALLRRPLEWMKTEKTGNMVSHTMIREKRSITVGDTVSIIIPAYNEASMLRQNIKSIRETIEPIMESYQIIIMEDGNTDGTNIIAEELAEENPWILHLHSDKRLGKGGALKRAIKTSQGEIIVFMDADLATSLDYLSRIMEPIKNGHDIAIGSRNIKGACVKRSFSRSVASMAYNLFVRLLFRDGICDHQCGFKAFRQALVSLVEDVESDGFLFDTELIIKAKQKGFLMAEVPVTWREPEGRNSRVRLFRDGMRMGLELLTMRVKLWRH